MEAAVCNSARRAASLVRHSSSEVSSCTMAAAASASVPPPHSPPAADSASIWLHCKKPATSTFPASPAAGSPPLPEGDYGPWHSPV